MPQRQAVPTVTVRTPEAMGADSWVIFRKSPHLAGYRSAMQIQLEEQGVVFDAAGRPRGGEFTIEQIERVGMEKLAESLVDWNWVGDEGEPLPKPNPDDVDWTIRMFNENLRRIEIDYLSEKLAEFLERPGNSKRSRHSSRR